MRSSFNKKTRLFRTWITGHPLWCAWQVTYRCNFRCRFCGYWHDAMGLEPEPSPEQYRSGARKLACFGTKLISLAGGEPFLRTDLPEIIDAIAEFHMPFVTTNGWLVDRAAAEAVMNSGLWGVSVSIDYAAPARHDDARGMAGAWKQAWRAVELFSQARKHDYQRVNVMGVLLEDNLDEIETVMRMAAERNAYFMIQPYGFRKTGSRKHEPQGQQLSPKLLELWRRNRNFLSNPHYLGKFDEFFAGGIPDCRAGRAFYNIDSTGDIAICVENRPRPVANLFRDSQYLIAERLARASRANPCTDCWYNCRGEVESLYKPHSLLASLPTFLFNNGRADEESSMGRWQ